MYSTYTYISQVPGKEANVNVRIRSDNATRRMDLLSSKVHTDDAPVSLCLLLPRSYGVSGHSSKAKVLTGNPRA